MPDFAPPGLEPDIPVDAALVAAAHEGVRTAITAAERLAGGARFTYAVCRPPGHHAGPDFLGGYCYLNNAAAAVRTLAEAGVRPVGVLDLDLHYPNGTAALVERMTGATLHSLHAAPVTNVAAGTVLPQVERERVVAFAAAPDAGTYLDEVARLGRGRWRPAPRRWSSRSATTPSPATRTAPGASSRRSSPTIGRLLAGAGPAGLRDPGGRLLAAGAGRLQPRLRHRPARRGGGDERAGAVPPPPRRDRRRDRPPARRALRDLPRSRRLQERPRDPDDAARPGRRGPRPLPRPRRRGRPPGRVHRRPLRPADRRHLQGGGRADGARRRRRRNGARSENGEGRRRELPPRQADLPQRRRQAAA